MRVLDPRAFIALPHAGQHRRFDEIGNALLHHVGDTGLGGADVPFEPAIAGDRVAGGAALNDPDADRAVGHLEAEPRSGRAASSSAQRWTSSMMLGGSEDGVDAEIDTRGVTGKAGDFRQHAAASLVAVDDGHERRLTDETRRAARPQPRPYA